MSAEAQKSITGSSRRKEALTLFLALATALLTISCAEPQNGKPIAQNQPPATEEKVGLEKNSPTVYGKPGPGMIRVYIGGSDCTAGGIYYFKTGTTLQEALAATKYTDFARRFCVYNRAENSPTRIRYQLRHLSDAEKARVLHDNDCVAFLCTFL